MAITSVNQAMRQTDFCAKMRQCTTQQEVFEVIHNALVDLRRQGIMRSLTSALQGISALSPGQLELWTVAAQQALDEHADGRTCVDGNVAALERELLDSATQRLEQLAAMARPRLLWFDHEPDSGVSGE